MKNMMRTVMKHTHSCSVITCTLLAVLGLAQPVQAGGKDDPLLSKVMIDQLELRDVDGSNPLVLEGQAWLGKDLQKLWIKADVERVAGETEELELQALYSQAIAPYWDLQVGLPPCVCRWNTNCY